MDNLRLFQRQTEGKVYWSNRDWITFLDSMYNDVIQDDRLLYINNRLKYENREPFHREKQIIIEVIKELYTSNGLGIIELIKYYDNNNFSLDKVVISILNNQFSPISLNTNLTWENNSVLFTGEQSRAGILTGGHNLYSPRAWYYNGYTIIFMHGIYTDDGFGQCYLLVYHENDGIIGIFRATNTEPISDSHTTPSGIVDNNGHIIITQERTHGSPIDIYESNSPENFNDFTLLAEKIGGAGATLGYMNLMKMSDGNGMTWCRFGTGGIRHQCVVEATNGFKDWGEERRLSTSPGSPLAHYVNIPYYTQVVNGKRFVMNCEREDELVNFLGFWQKYYVYWTPESGPERNKVFYNLAGTPHSHDTSGDNYFTKGIMDTYYRFYNAGSSGANGWIPVATVGPNEEFYCITGNGVGVLLFHSIINRVITTIPLSIENYASDVNSQASAVKSLAHINGRLELVIDIVVGSISKLYFFTSIDNGVTWDGNIDMTPEAEEGTTGFTIPMNYHEIPNNRNFAMAFFEDDINTPGTRKLRIKRAAKGTIQSETPRVIVKPTVYGNEHNVFHYLSQDSSMVKSGNNIITLTDLFGLRDAVGVNNPQHDGNDTASTNGTNSYFSIPVNGQTREKFTLIALAKGVGTNQASLLSFADNTSGSRFLTFSVYDSALGSTSVNLRDDVGRNLKEVGQFNTGDNQFHLIAWMIDARCKVDTIIDFERQFYKSDGYTGGITDYAKRGKSNFGGTFNSIRIGSRDTNTTDIFNVIFFKRIILYKTIFSYDNFKGIYQKVADDHGISTNWKKW